MIVSVLRHQSFLSLTSNLTTCSKVADLTSVTLVSPRVLKQSKTDCALNRLPAWFTVLPKKASCFVDSYGKKCVFNALSEAGKTLLVVRED